MKFAPGHILDGLNRLHRERHLGQSEIWALAVFSTREAGTAQAPMMLLPALNAMFDIATPRTEAARLHPPLMIFGMLGALFAGYDMAIRRRLNVLKSTDYDATGGMYSIGRGTSALSRLLAFDASFDKDGWKQRGATW